MAETKLYFAPPLALNEGQTVSQSAPALYGILHGRPMFGSVDVHLNDQSVVCDAGSLLWMQDTLEMETGMAGGCQASVARSCAGESCCFNTYSGVGMVGLGFLLPGDICSFEVTQDHGWVLSKGSFICGSTNIKVSARFAGCCAAAYSGEGMFLTKVTLQDGDGPGIFFAGGYGGIDRHEVKAGVQLLIDNGLFFAAGDKQKLRMGFTDGGYKSMFFSGEGLVMKLRGPCVVFTQNRDPSIFQPPQDTSGNGDPIA